MALRSLRLTTYLRRIPKFSSSVLRHNPLIQPEPDYFRTSSIISLATPSQVSRPFTSTTSLFRKVFDPDTDEIGPDTILFEGCDYNHWLITMDFPKDNPPTREQMIETYVNTAAQVFGSVEEAKKKIYALSTTTYQGFQVECSEETSNKFQNLPGVVFVLPDSYIDPVNKEYGGDKYVNGEIFPRPPPVMYRRRPDRRERNYGPPEQQQHYQNQPPQQPNYRPPPQQNYSPSQQQQNYTPPQQQQQQSYAPPQQQSYGAPSQPNNRPPPHQNYGPPPHQNYGLPPQQQSYGAPQQPNSRLPPQQNYGPSPQQNNPSQPPRPNYGAPPQPAYGGHQQQNYPPQPQQGYYSPPPPHSYAPQHQPSYGHSGSHSPPNYGPSIERNQGPPYSGNVDQVQHGNPHAQGYENGRFQGGGN